MVVVSRRRVGLWQAAVLLTGAVCLGVALFAFDTGDNPSPSRTSRALPARTVLAPATSASRLVAAAWYLLFDQSEVDQITPEMANAKLGSRLSFHTDGTVEGVTGFGGGCDAFRATYVTRDDTLSLGPLVGTLDCGASGALEIRARLAKVHRFEFVGDNLVLRDIDAHPLLVYSKYSSPGP